MTEVRTRRAAVVLAGLLVVLMSTLLAGHAFAQQDPTDQTDTTDTVDTGPNTSGRPHAIHRTPSSSSRAASTTNTRASGEYPSAVCL